MLVEVTLFSLYLFTAGPLYYFYLLCVLMCTYSKYLEVSEQLSIVLGISDVGHRSNSPSILIASTLPTVPLPAWCLDSVWSGHLPITNSLYM